MTVQLVKVYSSRGFKFGRDCSSRNAKWYVKVTLKNGEKEYKALSEIEDEGVVLLSVTLFPSYIPSTFIEAVRDECKNRKLPLPTEQKKENDKLPFTPFYQKKTAKTAKSENKPKSFQDPPQEPKVFTIGKYQLIPSALYGWMIRTSQEKPWTMLKDVEHMVALDIQAALSQFCRYHYVPQELVLAVNAQATVNRPELLSSLSPRHMADPRAPMLGVYSRAVFGSNISPVITIGGYLFKQTNGVMWVVQLPPSREWLDIEVLTEQDLKGLMMFITRPIITPFPADLIQEIKFRLTIKQQLSHMQQSLQQQSTPKSEDHAPEWFNPHPSYQEVLMDILANMEVIEGGLLGGLCAYCDDYILVKSIRSPEETIWTVARNTSYRSKSDFVTKIRQTRRHIEDNNSTYEFNVLGAAIQCILNFYR